MTDALQILRGTAARSARSMRFRWHDHCSRRVPEEEITMYYGIGGTVLLILLVLILLGRI